MIVINRWELYKNGVLARHFGFVESGIQNQHRKKQLQRLSHQQVLFTPPTNSVMRQVAGKAEIGSYFTANIVSDDDDRVSGAEFSHYSYVVYC